MKHLFFRNNILKWYLDYKRDLPWRKSSNAYHIWISEVILQQTRIEQGTSYYTRFLEKFPNVKSLASAKENDVLTVWQGLGYYSRARNLHAGARQIMEDYEGKIPQNAAELKKIKGIGNYTSAAIASIAYNEPVATVDGNAYRVLSRFFGIETPIDTSTGKKTFETLALKVLDKKQPGDFNQAIMDFGSMQCSPVNPNCEVCPLNNNCIAFNNKQVKVLPKKSKRIKIKNRYFFYFLIESNGHIFMRKRSDKDIWKGLFDFPLIEKPDTHNISDIVKSEEFNRLINNSDAEIYFVSDIIKHQLTHQKLHIVFSHIKLKRSNYSFPDFIKTNKKNIFDLPVPKVIENYIAKMIQID